MIGKGGFVKYDMTRDVDSAGGLVVASVSSVIGRVTKEDASHRARMEFVWSSS